MVPRKFRVSDLSILYFFTLEYRVAHVSLRKVFHSRRRRTDILDVGETTVGVGELTVGETTRRRNDRNSLPGVWHGI